MPPDLDRRMYDILRLVDRHEPIGSIQLVELMQLHGYDIKDRTIRLALSELDELGMTEKVPGKGRRLTDRGRTELEEGDVGGRLEQIRARIAQLTSRVTYDPVEDTGDLIACGVFVDEADVDDALALVSRLESLPLGPIPVSFAESDEDEPGDYRLLAPSSIPLDGALLARGIDTSLTNAGVLEYAADDDRDSDDRGADRPAIADLGGRIVRTVDVIDGEGSSIDVIALLIEAGRADVSSLLDSNGRGYLLGDSREFPINRFEEARDLTLSTRAALGGVVEFQRPRERDRFPGSHSTWTFGSITYVGTGELLLTAFSENELATEWETLYGMVPRRELEPVEGIPRTDARSD